MEGGNRPTTVFGTPCHIFGAVDLKTKGTVMSLKAPGFRIDAFTKAILRANRLRSFGGGFTLSEGSIPEAIKLYEGRRALGLGEGELEVCLGKLDTFRARQSRPPR